MKVLYDHQMFGNQNIGGISRYFSELLKFNPTAELSLRYSDNVYLREPCFKKYKVLSKNYEYERFFPNFKFKGKGRLFRYCNNIFQNINQAVSINCLKKSDYDIFHPTYYDPYFLKYLQGKPFVLTIHDMIFELFPQYFLSDKNMVPNKRKLILSACQIIAISEQTKKDLLQFFPEVQEKITIIYHGFSFPILNNSEKKENYILFTGSRGAYKNFNAFARAVSPLLIKYNLRLICTGYNFNSEEKELLENLRITDRTTCKFTSDKELIELYAKAIAFVFPSLYEGFGIPVLEAFASGCPAILANTSSLPEIGADAAVYFDPYSIDDMRTQIDRVISSPALQKELIIKGKDRAKQFSWEKCAKETMEVYKQISPPRLILVKNYCRITVTSASKNFIDFNNRKAG
ncbi:glycosyltransferase family 4 protein [Breznakiellaceae bacterium SP9]